MLTHNSGIEDSDVYDESYGPGDPNIGLAAFEEGYLTPGGPYWDAANFAERRPGAGFVYSNVGASLGALAVADAAGMEFKDLVERDILGPLDMEQSGYFFADLSTEPSKLHWRAGRRTYRYWEPYGYPTYPDGMLHSTANDIARFGAMVLGGGVLDGVRVLPAERVEEMLTVDPALGTDEDGQAVVWARRTLAGRDLRGHNGGDYGSYTDLWFDREAGAGMAILFNGTLMSPEDRDLVFALEDALLDLAED